MASLTIAGAVQQLGERPAMRVSPVGIAAQSIEEALTEAERSASATYDHPEEIRGAQAVALAVFLARTASSRAEIREEIECRIGYDLSLASEEIRPGNMPTRCRAAASSDRR